MAKAKKATKKAASKKAPSTRVALVEKNGIKRPKETGKTHVPWAVADKLTEKHGRPATRAEVIAECAKKGCAPKMVTSQYQCWRVWNGIPSARGSAGKAKTKKAPAKKAASKKPAAKKAAKAKPAKKAKATPPAPPAPPVEAAATA